MDGVQSWTPVEQASGAALARTTFSATSVSSGAYIRAMPGRHDSES